MAVDSEHLDECWLDPADIARLLTEQNECTFMWVTKDGQAFGVIMSYFFRDGRFWLTSAEKRVRVAAGLEHQVRGHDRHAALLAAIAVAGGSIERLATEVRLLQQSEIDEVREPFRAGQAGSSAMPQKRNPDVLELVRTLGFKPTMLLRPAGTRPDPAVSVPSAKSASPVATTRAEPELEPPET